MKQPGIVPWFFCAQKWDKNGVFEAFIILLTIPENGVSCHSSIGCGWRTSRSPTLSLSVHISFRGLTIAS